MCRWLGFPVEEARIEPDSHYELGPFVDFSYVWCTADATSLLRCSGVQEDASSNQYYPRQSARLTCETVRLMDGGERSLVRGDVQVCSLCAALSCLPRVGLTASTAGL